MARAIDRITQFFMLGLVLSVGLMGVPNAFAVDNDLDGYDGLVDDCNDNDPNINPGATEIPGDGVDQNCDGLELCYIDSDGDSFGHTVNTIASPDLICGNDPDEGIDNSDCNDSNANVYPGNIEVCDGLDNNCNSLIDDEISEVGQLCDGPDADSCEEGTVQCIAGSLICDDTTGDTVEICDDGVDNDCDGTIDVCQDVCATLPDGEFCDDGNPTTIGDQCIAGFCTGFPTICGDGAIEGLEECDDGNTTPGDGCSDTCTLESSGVCGNGITESGEQCDDANNINGDGCNQNCQIECSADVDCSDPNYPICGDDGFGGLACIAASGSVCGNGVTESGEQCDDGNTTSGDGCSANCLNEGAAQGTGSVDVLATCGLEIVSGNPINYGQLFPGAISEPEKTLILDNTGNTEATLLVRGSQWTADGIDVMNVDVTKYAIIPGQDYALQKIALTTSDEILDPTFDPVINTESQWQLKADLLVDSFAGTATQTMDFTATC